MQVENIDKIAYQNVVSQTKKFYYTEFEKVFQEFVEGIVKTNASIKGPYFYSLNNTPFDELIEIEMFMPIYDTTFESEGYKFQTYYEVGPLMKTQITQNFETTTETAYFYLLKTLEINTLEIHTPFYHIPAKDGSKYIDIYVGYKEKTTKAVF